MLKKLTHIGLFVSNQDEALEFYTKKLGFSVHTDAMFGENMRWLTLKLEGDPDLELILSKAESAEDKALVGKQGGQRPFLCFSSDDCHKTHAMLKENGVRILSEPEAQSWGIAMTVADLYGNLLYIVQPV